MRQETFEEFLTGWDAYSRRAHQRIPLFDPDKSGCLLSIQKKYFVKLFWHARAYFINFLWFLGNYAPGASQKEKVLAHIIDEFGADTLSHDQLYLNFAKNLNVDLKNEILQQSSYLPFLKTYNQKHLSWLYAHDWESRLCSFAAYERLDNIDYADLLKLVKAWKIPRRGRVFFEIHARAEHYTMVNEGDVERIWKKNPKKVKEAFLFIGHHQLSMWRQLSRKVLLYRP